MLVSTVRGRGWVVFLPRLAPQHPFAPRTVLMCFYVEAVNEADGTISMQESEAAQSGVLLGIDAELVDSREKGGAFGTHACGAIFFSSEAPPRQRRAQPQELTRTRGGNDPVSLNRRLDCISRNIVERQRLFADPD